MVVLASVVRVHKAHVLGGLLVPMWSLKRSLYWVVCNPCGTKVLENLIELTVITSI